MPIFSAHNALIFWAPFYYTLFRFNQSHHFTRPSSTSNPLLSIVFSPFFWDISHHRHSYHKIKWKVFILTFSLLNPKQGKNVINGWEFWDLSHLSKNWITYFVYFGNDQLSYYVVVCVCVWGHFGRELEIVVIEIHYQYLTLWNEFTLLSLTTSLHGDWGLFRS